MQKSLSFSKGITTSPSDLLSDDSELVESVGTIFRSGELHPIQSPVNVGSVVGTIVHVHRGNGFTNIITIDRHSLYAYSSNDFFPVNIDSYTSYVFTGVFRSASSVNNTLLIATSEGIFYFLFKNGVYKALGSELPSFVFRPYFSPIDVRPSGRTACKLSEILYRQKWFLVYNDDGTLEFPTKSEEVPGEYNAFFVKDQDDKRSAFQTAVQGSMAEAIAAVKKINAFAFPFFLRVALRLFDGSYARISNPIACFPTINRNCRFFPVKRTDDSWVETSENVYDWMCDIVYSYLNFQAYLTNAAGWEDIVKEVVVFASEEVLPFSIDDNWSIHHADETQNTAYANYMEDTFNWHFSDFSPQTQAHDIILPTYKSDTEIIDQMLARTQFFKLFSLKLSSPLLDGAVHHAPVTGVTVSTLAQQEQLQVDDYYGWTRRIPSKMFSYNKRINTFGVDRYPFSGFSVFSNRSSGDSQYTFYTHILANNMDTWVASESEHSNAIAVGTWFYYPDPNATECIILQHSSDTCMHISLTPHPLLNGAYAFLKLPLGTSFKPDGSTVPSVDNTAHESLESQIFTSVVNNPFVFEASGDNTVGTGSIVGISSNAEAISQGQFGQYPLIVFTTEGTYAMAVTSDGLYSSSYPISREVCDNPDSITPTDRLIFFTSSKGLMAVSGSSVVCVSNQLRGRNPSRFLSVGDGDFLAFIKDALIAYDYRSSLLHIVSKSRSYEYVYSIPDSTFAVAKRNNPVLSVANAYPDFYVQDSSLQVSSFESTPDINADTRRYYMTFTTRPLKLGSSLQLKTIHQIVHLLNSTDGTLTLSIYASNDCRNWTALHSLHGKPWKYFRFQYTMFNLSASDTFSGTIVDFTPIFTNKIR